MPSYKKEDVAWYLVSKSWKRCVVFLKLSRHKVWNGSLQWDWEEYKHSLLAVFRDSEARIIMWQTFDWRGWDRKSIDYKEKEKVKLPYSNYEIDELCRQAIKNISDRYN
jgi:hypothetical protein